MIISHKHKYLFIGTPRTGSTAISKELAKNYDGNSILRKHANYFEFEKIATEKEKKYFVFASVRNPVDDVVSIYTRLLTNHNSNFTSKRKLLKNGGWVTRRKIKQYKFVQNKNNTFKDFLKNFYRLPYTSQININKPHCNYIIRFENLDEDFTKVLEILGIRKIRPLPIINKTEDKNNYLEYYDEDIIEHAVKILGPFMLEWGYKFPEEWPNRRISYISQKKYEIAKQLRLYYCKYIKSGPFRGVRFLRELLE
jgi:hypothetical protein